MCKTLRKTPIGRLAAFLLAAAMVLTLLHPAGAYAGPAGERFMTLDAAQTNTGRLKSLLEQGWTVHVTMPDGSSHITIKPGEEIPAIIFTFAEPSYVLLTESPHHSAPRESHPTNGAMHAAILEFVMENITNENLGSILGTANIQMTAEEKRLSDDLISRMRKAASKDPAYKAFGLSEAGKDLFYDEITVFFRTANANAAPGFWFASSRQATIALNTIENGRVTPRDPEAIVKTILHEIEGHGRGPYCDKLCRLVEEHLGAISYAQSGLSWDPSLERAVGEAAGGVHLLFEAVENGQATYHKFMNENISGANEYFTFNYSQWQSAFNVDTNIRRRNEETTQAFIQKGLYGNQRTPLAAVRQGQSDIHKAIDTSLTPEQRKKYGQQANQFVLLLASIGEELYSARGTPSNCRLLAININNPDTRIISCCWAGLCEGVYRPSIQAP